MLSKIHKIVHESLQDVVDAGLPTSPFTNRRLKDLGVKIPVIKMGPEKIKRVRKTAHFSQSVFAQVLNVSLASVRHWEQGIREPSGSTKVLLELLYRNPHALDQLLPKALRAA